MSYVENFAEKISPNMIKTMLKPLLIILIMAPLALMVIGPIGSWLGNVLYFIIDTSNTYVPWLVPTLMGTFCPVLVMVGIHASLTPLASLGLASPARSENILGPGMLASNIAQAGASFAIGIKDKSLEVKEVALSAGVTALSGITEPALYGITLKYKRVLYCVMAAGGIAGLYAGITGVVRYSFGSPGIFTLVNFIGKPHNFTNAIITAVLAFVLSFAFTFIFAKIENKKETISKTSVLDEVYAPVDGKVYPLSEVDDEVFASGSLGEGVAILPESDLIVAPVNGKVSMVYKTGHALGLTSDSGREYLLHIGINTVNLKDDGFDVQVKENQIVKAGDPLIQVDFAKIKEHGFDPSVIVVALNTSKQRIKTNPKKNAVIDDVIFSVVNEGVN